MAYGYIYKIVFPNGKHYIGLTTTSLEQRRKQHKINAKNGDVKCLYTALRKYNMVDTVELIGIDTADTLEELCEKEIGYIKEYNSYYMNKNGYNMTYGGEGTNGYIYTEEDNKKNSERLKKYFEEHPEFGKQHSEKMKKYYEEHPEARKEHGEKMKKYFQNPEVRQQNREMLKKYWENPEARKKHSEIRQKYYEEHPEVGKQHSERMKKYYEDNPDAREKISEISKKIWENPEAKQQMSEIMKKYHEENPEARKEHGERMKKYHEENPNARKEHGEKMKKYFDANPNLGKEHSERMKKRFENNPNLGKEHSERMKKYYENPEARQKNIDAQKNRSPEWIKKKLDRLGQNKPFDVFTTDGTFIKTFTYQFEAKEYFQKEFHITSNISMRAVLAGRIKSSAGFIFKYK